MQRNNSTKHNVEIVTTDDLYAQFAARKSVRQAKATKAQADAKAKSSDFWRRWGIRIVGASLSLALHALLIGGAVMGASGRPPAKPHMEGMTSNDPSDNATEFSPILLLASEHSITPPDEALGSSVYTQPELSEKEFRRSLLVTSIDMPEPPKLSGSDEDGEEASSLLDAAGDDAGRVMLFGRYMGQIKARIERGWEMPSKSSVRQFECVVQIKQGLDGQVQEVTLQRCGDDPLWQISLVHAIERASPLSAPPNETVFSAVLTLSFAGTVRAD